MVTKETFRKLLIANSSAKDWYEHEVNCPGHKSGDCYNHEVGHFIFSSFDEEYISSLCFITDHGQIESFRLHPSEKIHCHLRTRGMSSMTLYDCEIHGQWVERRLFHKGKTYLDKFFYDHRCGFSHNYIENLSIACD